MPRLRLPGRKRTIGLLVVATAVLGLALVLPGSPLAARFSPLESGPDLERGPFPEYALKERILNLADDPDATGRYRYLRLIVAMEFIGPGLVEFQHAEGEARAKKSEEMAKALSSRFGPAINDAMTTAMHGKRTEDIRLDGRYERLRSELALRFNQVPRLAESGYRVVKVLILDIQYQ